MVEPNRTEKLYLRYEFTDAEILQLSQDLARAGREKRALEMQKAQVTKQLAGDIAAKDAKLERIGNLVFERAEYRNIDCGIWYDYPRQGLATVTRLDTGEVVRERRMTADELQMALDLSKQEEGSTYADAVEDTETPGALAPAAVAHGGMGELKKQRKARAKAKAAPGDGSSCEVAQAPAAVVDGEDAPLREHNWTHERGRATVRIYDDQGALSALTNIEIDGLEIPVEYSTALEGLQSINHMGVASFSQLEHWCRENARANGITAQIKSALAQLLTWSREQAGAYRQAGKLAAEAQAS